MWLEWVPCASALLLGGAASGAQGGFWRGWLDWLGGFGLARYGETAKTQDEA